jgi:hypothetical protein
MTDPQPVEVKNEEPLPVTIETRDTAAQSTARATAASAGVDAAILQTEDQRRISGIWERTQQVIALSVVLTSLLVVSLLVVVPGLADLQGYDVDQGAQTAAAGGLLFLTAVSNLVIGFYFGRTNHQRVGGFGGDDRTR